ncbi:MAG: protein translocase subunit SecDF [Bacteroidales bacterium]|nr:protein translocase subunit SecDF [Bacteroidales bacterium]
MQNKGAIRLFAILLVLASIYSLSFTYFTRTIENQATEQSTDPKTGELNLRKMNEYLDSMRSEPAYLFDFFTYSECKDKELNFGLDLKGGMNVTLEISVVDLIKALAADPNDTIVINTVERAQKLQENSTDGFVNLFGVAFNELYPNLRLASYFSTLNNKDELSYNSSNEDVLVYLNKEAKSAIDNSFNILRTRIDRFGVTQPNIQSLGSGRILVELPGVKDPARVRKLLQGTAQLEFWETYDAKDIYQYLVQANKIVSDLNKIESDFQDTLKSKDSTVASVDTTTAQAKDTAKTASLLDEMKSDTTKKDTSNLNQDAEVALFSKLMITPDGKNLFSGPVAGVSHVKDTGTVNSYLALEQVKRIMPKDLKFLWTIKAMDESGNLFQLIALKLPKDGKAPLDGDAITNAGIDYADNATSAGVSMSMHSEGAQVWARLTKENINKSIAIVLDNYVYSFPNVNSEITGGRSSITGNFTINEARDLANVLKSGKLPAPAKIIEEVVVGPSLGKEAISSGLWSFAIAFLLVLVYMVFYYNKGGYIANLALLTNVVLIFGVLASLGAVLTLPGIAGIVLTIGMAVDANILIFERIKEEMRQGKGPKLAITDGYKNAYSAIIDANVTTLITAIILYIFGSGPIQGFATTLIIGIVTSLFSAIFITRLVFERLLVKKSEVKLDTKATRNFMQNTTFNFMDSRKKWYVVSAILLTISLVSIFSKGWNVGIDFTGGRTYVVRLENAANVTEIRNALGAKEIFGNAPDVKIYGQNNQVKITTKYLIDDKSSVTDSIVEQKLFEGLKPVLGSTNTMTEFNENNKMSSQKVGPTIADDIVWSAILAVFFSLLFIFFYIFIRFRDWRFGLGAVGSLFHDVLLVLGAFSIFHGILPFSLEIDQAFIAAILTVIGYSINDTVVVFDRVREYFGMESKKDTKTLLNDALNSTLSRTIGTSLTTLIVLVAIFIFGGETIRGFVFAILLGIGVGTYSSIFVASPIVYDTMKKKENK